MQEKIQIQKSGKLRIYLKTGETITSKTFLRKLFTKSALGKYWKRHVMRDYYMPTFFIHNRHTKKAIRYNIKPLKETITA